jgi:hypothetical protein
VQPPYWPTEKKTVEASASPNRTDRALASAREWSPATWFAIATTLLTIASIAIFIQGDYPGLFADTSARSEHAGTPRQLEEARDTFRLRYLALGLPASLVALVCAIAGGLAAQRAWRVSREIKTARPWIAWLVMVAVGAIVWVPLSFAALLFVGYLDLATLLAAPAVLALLIALDSPRLRAWPFIVICVALWVYTLGTLCLGISDSTLG